jgi:hypothetical protein
LAGGLSEDVLDPDGGIRWGVGYFCLVDHQVFAAQSGPAGKVAGGPDRLAKDPDPQGNAGAEARLVAPG